MISAGAIFGGVEHEHMHIQKTLKMIGKKGLIEDDLTKKRTSHYPTDPFWITVLELCPSRSNCSK